MFDSLQHVGSMGGLAQKANLPDDPTCFFWGGCGQFSSRVTRHLRCTFGLEFEVCLCLSLVLLLRFSG